MLDSQTSRSENEMLINRNRGYVLGARLFHQPRKRFLTTAKDRQVSPRINSQLFVEPLREAPGTYEG